MKQSDAPIEISVPTWTGHGTGMLSRRTALPSEHPESEYNWILKNYPGVDPVWYGAKPPRDRCECCGKFKADEDEEQYW